VRQEHGVKELVEIRHGDALEVDLSPATTLFLYLVPQVSDLVVYDSSRLTGSELLRCL
jgi:hypothetical protein